MDIKQLRYFLSIIENDFNLSKTAEYLYLSQPALSFMITDFERKNEMKLFERSKGRITGLTAKGEILYHEAKKVIKTYQEMEHHLFSDQNNLMGTISIGIPPLVLSIVFSDILPKIILDSPNVQFNIKELGADLLRNELIAETIDLAVLLEPEKINEGILESFLIQESELSVFISKKHKFANKNEISWQMLHNEKMAIFDNSFSIHHLVLERFELNDIHPNIVLQSSSWDFLLNATLVNSDMLCILPEPVSQQYSIPDLHVLRLNKPIPWKVKLCRIKKERYNSLESTILDELLSSLRFNG